MGARSLRQPKNPSPRHTRYVLWCVLTGIIATLMSQGLAPVDAARVGAYWHGLAGRYASQRRPVGVIASDVADALGDALPATNEGATLVPVM